jgi:hypothetical protein
VNQSITSDDEYEDDHMPLDVANFMHYQFSTTPEEHHDMNSSTTALFGKYCHHETLTAITKHAVLNTAAH